MGHSADWVIAVAAGAILAVMIHVNSMLAAHSSALFASWLAHGVGAAVALLFVGVSWLRRKSVSSHAATDAARTRAPFWAYLGGIPGAFTVVLATITINGGLALSGTLALMLVGQVAFGMVCDGLGLFGVARRRLGSADLLGVLAILSGSTLLLLGGA